MKLYRFSPITSEEGLLEAIQYLHQANHKLCFETIGRLLPVRGCIGVFCHDYEEFSFLTKLRQQLTYPAPNYNGKYYPLKHPITFPEQDGVPAATYEYLYIRQADPYRSQVGDVDFVMPHDRFEKLKAGLVTGEFRHGARLFERPEENMVELWLPEYDVVSFIAETYMKNEVK